MNHSTTTLIPTAQPHVDTHSTTMLIPMDPRTHQYRRTNQTHKSTHEAMDLHRYPRTTDERREKREVREERDLL